MSSSISRSSCGSPSPGRDRSRSTICFSAPRATPIARWSTARQSRSGGVRSQHRFDLEEVAQAVLAPFAAVARALEPAEGGVHIAASSVQYDLPGADASANVSGARRIFGPYVRGEPVGGVIRDPNRLLFALVRQDAQHRS